MDYGLTATGFNTKPLNVIKSEVEADLRAVFGSQIDLLPEALFGQLVGVESDRVAEVWELAEAIYNSQYPDTADDTSLDNVAAITAVKRLAATPSISEQQALFGLVATVVPVGTQFSVSGNPAIVFETDAQVTLVAGADEVQDITFSGVPTSGAFKLVYKGETTVAINWDDVAVDVETALNNLSLLSGVTVAGSYAAGFTITFAGNDEKQEQPLLVETDNTLFIAVAVTIIIAQTVAGVYQGLTTATATATGPLVAPAQTLTVIDNPVAGLSSTRNVIDADVGRNIETDAELRQRRKERIVTSTAATVDAIRSQLLKLNETEDPILLEDVTILNNVTILTDSRGIPGKAFETFVLQTANSTARDAEIAQVILDSKPAGIEPHGDVLIVVKDSQGFDNNIKFSRPVDVDIYLELDLTVNTDYPVNGDAVVEAAMLAWGTALGAGVSVIVFPSLVAQLDDVPGITDVVVKIGIAPAPALDNNIIIDDGSVAQVEISRWDSARVTVNS